MFYGSVRQKARTINICYIFRQDNATAGPRIGRGGGRRRMGGEKEEGGGGRRGGQGVTKTALILGRMEDEL